MTQTQDLRLAIDIGGTFTDTVLATHSGDVLSTTKTPTTPTRPALSALDGAQHVLNSAGADWSHLTGFVHGTTLATNALIERRGARVATITTEGFRDTLEIGYERRYSQYDINLTKPDLLVPRRLSFTIRGRMDAQGQERVPLDESAVDQLVDAMRTEHVDAVAICLLHAYANPEHELRLRTLLSSAMPDLVISLSHEVSPEAREFDRLCTTIANAYIQPLMQRYLLDFQERFQASGLRCPIMMMTASGGMTTLATAARLPIRLVESGPAGGAILASRIARETAAEEVLSFDMGGTTAKLCLIDNFRPQNARKFEIARMERFIKGSGMPVRIPVIEMIEIGAGGGSIASLDRLGRVQVGPQSAGAEPGPAAFGKGGTDPTVTDADVAQGLIDPERFAEGRLKISVPSAVAAIDRVFSVALKQATDVAAQGVSEIVGESMASAARMHAVESGKDLSARVMIAFGGNGPLHATRVARRAQIDRILVPRDPGVGSALGFLYAPVSFEIVRSRYTVLKDMDVAQINSFLSGLETEAADVVRAGAPDAELTRRRVAFMRYQGQGHEIEIATQDRPLTRADIGALQASFEQEYSKQFSRSVPGMDIEILNWAVSVFANTEAVATTTTTPRANTVVASERRSVLCDVTGAWREADVFDRAALKPGDRLTGPALIVEPQTTTYVSTDFSAQMDAAGNLLLTRDREAGR